MRNRVLQRRARALRNDATDAERRLWQHLRNRQLGGYRFRRQVPVAGYIADFACLEAQLIVELDGGQHVERQHYDERRDRDLRAAGFRVMRFWDNAALRETEAVLEAIWSALSQSPHPDLPPQAGEGEVGRDAGLPLRAGEGELGRDAGLPLRAGEGEPGQDACPPLRAGERELGRDAGLPLRARDTG